MLELTGKPPQKSWRALIALRVRGIRIIDAMAFYISVLKQPGMALPDQRHLNAEGCRKLATMLAGMLQ